MEMPCRVLALEDRPEDVELAEMELAKGYRPFTVKRVDSREGLFRMLDDWQPHLVLCDYTLPDFNGLEALEMIRERAPGTPVVMYTGTVDEETAVLCLKSGADDYILKDNPARLHSAVEAALRAREERTEKERAQIALEESEERFRGLVETAHDAIVSFGGDGAVSYVNPAGEAVFGYSADEIRGRSIRLLLEDPGAGSLETNFDEAALGDPESGAPEPLELMGRRGDGTTFPAEVSLSGYRNEEGRRFNAIIRDVTDRVLAREAIESLSRDHEILLNAAGEGILGLDADGAVTFVNPAASENLGRAPRELLGEDFHLVAHEDVGSPESRGPEECPVQLALRTGSEFRGELDFARKGGELFPVALSFVPILEDGMVSGGVVVFEDITQRRAAEESLRASEERYRGLVENATYGIYQSTADGRFLAVNPALVEILGYDSREELMAVDMGRDLYLDEEERRRLVDAFQESGKVVGAETRWLRKDGAPVDVRLSGRGIWDEEGEFEVFEVMVEDLTERKVLEAQLRQAQKMEAVGQLTGGIAHDFNNVLSVVLLNAELLKSQAESGEEIDVAELEAIYDSAKRATSITRKLLGFSRQAELLIQPCPVGRVVGNMASMIRTALPETIEVSLDLQEKESVVMADQGSVEQILLNLVGNARDAMPDGGRLTVAVYETELDEEYAGKHVEVSAGPYLCLEVSDTGTGMDKETQQRVFEPFFTTMAPDSGTGLGLAMVYGLMRQQGGHINLYSQVGEGTVIRLYFPLQEAEEAPSAEDTETETVTDGIATLLLVEDEEHLREATRRALEKRGHTVLSAADGEGALEILRDSGEEIDLVLSDLVLPRMGGCELMRAARDEVGSIPFILTSGYSGEEAAARGLSDESVPFLRKPWVLKDLLDLIRQTLESEAQEGVESRG